MSHIAHNGLVVVHCVVRRFDYLRWTLFNESHAFMPDDHRAVGPLAGATKEAVEVTLTPNLYLL